MQFKFRRINVFTFLLDLGPPNRSCPESGLPTITSIVTDVGDGMCWWRFRQFWSSTSTIVLRLRWAPKFKRCSQDRNSVNNIQKFWPTSGHQHHDIINITVTVYSPEEFRPVPNQKWLFENEDLPAFGLFRLLRLFAVRQFMNILQFGVRWTLAWRNLCRAWLKGPWRRIELRKGSSFQDSLIVIRVTTDVRLGKIHAINSQWLTAVRKWFGWTVV